MVRWFSLTNLDLDGRNQFFFPKESDISQFLSQFGSLVEISLNHSNQLITSGSIALQESFSCISKFSEAFFIWSSTRSNSNVFRYMSKNSRGSYCRNNLSSTQIKHVLSGAKPLFFAKLASSSLNFLWMHVQKNQAFTLLALAAALVPPYDSLSSKVLAGSIPIEDHDEQTSRRSDGDYRGCSALRIPSISWSGDAVEPKTGIKFPTVLDTSFDGEENSHHHTSEVLVGIGSRTMRVIKIKSLKVYAFGLYIQPDSVCEKLCPKYADIPIDELQDRSDFFEDLIKEDIDMTVRLVVNCNSLKISSIRDAFEKSLRTRLQKMNPDTDYHCVRTFASYFQQEIPIPMGTTIDFRQTAEGQFITEIGGKLISAVHSKDLCKAFFDMYVGDSPVSDQAKQEIAQNVGGLIRRC